MATFGDLVVNLGLNAKPFTRGLGAARGSLGSFSSGITSLIPRIGSLGTALLSAAGVGGFGFMLKSSMDSMDAVAKMADTLGMATEQVTALQHAAGLAGVENEELDKAMVVMTKNISKGADAFKELGLSSDTLKAMSPSAQMGAIADGLNAVGNQTDKVRLATELFGKAGAKMLPMLQGGSAGLKDMAEDAAKLGITFSRVDAAKVEAANDAVSRMKAAFSGLFNTLAIEIAPTITAIANHIADFGGLVGEVARNWQSYWQIAANSFSAVILEATASAAGGFAGLFEAGKVAFDGIIQYAQLKFAQLGALFQQAFAELKGNDFEANVFKMAAGGFGSQASVIGSNIASQTADAFKSESSKIEGVFLDAAAALRAENGGIVEAIATSEQRRLEALTLAGDTATAAATGPAADPKGLIRGSRDAINSMVNLQNRHGGMDPQRQVANNTKRMVSDLDRMVLALQDIASNREPVVIGGFT